MICEICGRRTKVLYKVVVDGAVLNVCNSCKALGHPIDAKRKDIQKKNKAIKNVYEFEEELIDNYNKIIRFARESMNMSQEEAAKFLGIKISTYKSIEDGKIKPSLDLAKKIEKKFNIKLIRKVSLFEETGEEEPKLTIADVIEFEED